MNIITSSDLKNKRDAREKLNLIDVREPDEHSAFNIGDTLLPVGNILSMQVDEV